MIELDRDQLARAWGGGEAFDPAKSDGCTGAADGWWRTACVTHDRDIYSASTPADRKRADQALRKHMLKSGAPPAVAGLYYYGVRATSAFNDALERWGISPPRP